jgi:hypothetical protein
MRRVYKNLAVGLITASSVAVYLSSAQADPRPCRFGYKGVYVTWAKDSPSAGTGTFQTNNGRAAVLPNFTWEVTGSALSVKIAADEPFQGGNSMKGFYGQADDANNINVRIKANDVPPRTQIPHSAFLTLTFNGNTPASGWGFAVVDIDVDQVRFTAKDANGSSIATSEIARWFVQDFDANPSVSGVNIPSWDLKSAAVVGSESSSKTWRTTVEGNLPDTEAASAWFQPNKSLSELTFEYQSLQDSATPSYHVLLAACESPFIAPTPTPLAAGGDSDGDTIPDTSEGTDDGDNDERPNYLDKDSDGDSIPDAIEGTGDADGDGIPNYEDRDSDGDNVPDRIEVDPDAPDSTPSDTDDNNDGLDDEDSTRNIPPGDGDRDGIPDIYDTDSDNDGTPDGTEAYDLDGDGTPDITPSGKDEDSDGIDDAFKDIVSTAQVNREFVGETTAPCTSISLSATKQAVRRKLLALAERVPNFGRRAAACGGTLPSSLISKGAAARRSMERMLASSYDDNSLVCPTSVCAASSKAAEKAMLNSLASKLFTYAKKAKLNAIKVCKPQRNGGRDTRPQTEVYLKELRAAIADLPSSVSECD